MTLRQALELFEGLNEQFEQDGHSVEALVFPLGAAYAAIGPDNDPMAMASKESITGQALGQLVSNELSRLNTFREDGHPELDDDERAVQYRLFLLAAASMATGAQARFFHAIKMKEGPEREVELVKAADGHLRALGWLLLATGTIGVLRDPNYRREQRDED